MCNNHTDTSQWVAIWPYGQLPVLDRYTTTMVNICYCTSMSHPALSNSKIYLEFYTVLVRIFDNMEGLFLKGDIIYLYIMYEFLQNTLKFYDDINCKNKGSYKCNM